MEEPSASQTVDNCNINLALQSMSNQIQSMPTASATTSAMTNQQQMNVNMNYSTQQATAETNAANNNNFTMTNILNDMDPMLVGQPSNLHSLNSNLQINSIINASIDNQNNLQMQPPHQQQQIQNNSVTMAGIRDVVISGGTNN